MLDGGHFNQDEGQAERGKVAQQRARWPRQAAPLAAQPQWHHDEQYAYTRRDADGDRQDDDGLQAGLVDAAAAEAGVEQVAKADEIEKERPVVSGGRNVERISRDERGMVGGGDELAHGLVRGRAWRIEQGEAQRRRPLLYARYLVRGERRALEERRGHALCVAGGIWAGHHGHILEIGRAS